VCNAVVLKLFLPRPTLEEEKMFHAPTKWSVLTFY